MERAMELFDWRARYIKLCWLDAVAALRSRMWHECPSVSARRIHVITKRQVVTSLMGVFAASAALAAAVSPGLAQGYPDRPVRLVVAFAPGGTSDLITRIIASGMTPYMNGHAVIVENKSGGGGGIGATETARAKPDGYSLGAATVSTIGTVPAIQPATPYNPLTDFTPIVNVAATPNILAVNSQFPAKDFKGFMEEIKKNPGKYSYATSGTGGINHLLGEMFKSLTKTDMTHIPFRGSGPALNDTIGGQVTMIFDNVPTSLPHIKSGKLIPILVGSPQRLPNLPDVPTYAEVGLEPVNRTAFYGIYGPKDLPKEVVDKVNSAVVKALADPAVRQRIVENGAIPVGNTPEQFAAEIKAEFEAYKKIVTEQGLKPE
jgi:tripartite-type tricarboxylate transporter receptor subunit TctC